MSTPSKKPASFRFSPEVAARLERLTKRDGASKTDVMVAALEAYEDRGEPSNEALVAMLSKRLRGAGRGKLP